MGMKTCRRGHERPIDQQNCGPCRQVRGFSDVVAERIDPANLTRALREEWEHFAGYLWSDERIAEACGVSLATVRRQASRRKEMA